MTLTKGQMGKNQIGVAVDAWVRPIESSVRGEKKGRVGFLNSNRKLEGGGEICSSSTTRSESREEKTPGRGRMTRED